MQPRATADLENTRRQRNLRVIDRTRRTVTNIPLDQANRRVNGPIVRRQANRATPLNSNRPRPGGSRPAASGGNLVRGIVNALQSRTNRPTRARRPRRG